MSMSRKDYIAAAEIIAAANKANKDNTPTVRKAKNAALREVMEGLCSMFGRDNGHFDRYKFQTACGYGTVPTFDGLGRNDRPYWYGERVKVVSIDKRAKTVTVKRVATWDDAEHVVKITDLNY